ncbi:hypothetical protein NITHO_2210017 [Nitrolancea hollandica Lb]|uniref:Uncharacterized protein n=1 Tax=Nitrolancea hollandica Lb TaxID=1129897 RepID=I4EF60_9BACT|nr:hypothetical protein NITHO_2210017 [Nitrolancea hollandica Lb]
MSSTLMRPRHLFFRVKSRKMPEAAKSPGHYDRGFSVFDSQTPKMPYIAAPNRLSIVAAACSWSAGTRG